jgi:hypothetical protein
MKQRPAYAITTCAGNCTLPGVLATFMNDLPSHRTEVHYLIPSSPASTSEKTPFFPKTRQTILYHQPNPEKPHLPPRGREHSPKDEEREGREN